MVARDSEKLGSIKKQFSKIETFQCDLTKQQGLDELILCVEQNYPNGNMLINNAGVQYNYIFITDHDIINKIDYEINTNLTATIKLYKLLLPTLSKNNNAATINVSSRLTISPKKSAPVHCATKAAIHNCTKAFRYEMEETKLKVFEIIPPLVAKPMTDGRGKNKITPEELVKEFIMILKTID